ncbi:putative cbf nf-y family transcription factor [Phaeomoniella chlamydospora]|uniref:Putative cbf nf-y family transcription factor n=1 Tax=Phaeomoniella chlamydospora TaxID=158046 RepID=A0A0G2EE90_PHACM|nr:putative cbf nf-y family transcription factor [Phaeomoniella chlamydospora]
MQADEDVGKVAQAAPTAVSKALELFMITLVTKAATEAKEKSSKRISAQHLKAAIAKDEVLDFLNEIIEKVPDAAEAKGKHRAATDSPEADEGKKKRNARRKKSEGDD